MPSWLYVLSVIGVGCAVALVVHFGAGQVGGAFLSVGWGLPLVVGARAIQIGGAGLAWRAITPPVPPVPARRFVVLRFIREAINALLPVAQVGGDLIGGRLLTFSGPSGGVAGASIIVDIFVQVTTQFFYALLGFFTLYMLGVRSPLVEWIAKGLLVALPVLVLFFLAQRIGGFRLVERLVQKVSSGGQWFSLGAIGDLDANLRRIYGNPRGLATGFALHFGIWIFGSCEVWVALRFMGHPISLAQALALESLTQAVKGAAFAIPGAYGVQEGGFVALCAVLGVPAQLALALSLVKRVPDFVIGIPALIAWQGFEGRRLWKSRARKADGHTP